MSYAIEVLERELRLTKNTLVLANEVVRARIYFGEEPSWIEEAREEVRNVETQVDDLTKAINTLKEVSV